ncbi:MAG: FecR domain-containing protein [Leptospirales bacterium]|nr:FecR domain-containing protein [Leptospirales bacterium]
MRKKLFICVTLILVFGLVSGCSKRPDEFASVMFLMGDVFCNDAAVEIGVPLKQDDTIKTSELSFCDIKLGDSLIRIKEKSTVILSSLMQSDGNENVGLELLSGKMLCKPKKLLKSEQFVVKTPTAIAAVRGTDFTVETDANKTTRIKVFSGSMNIGKRVKQFEEHKEEIINNSSLVEQGFKAIVTKDDLEKAEKSIEKFMNLHKDESLESYAAFAAANREHIKIEENTVSKFSADDFEKDNTELIAIEEKPAEVVRKIAQIIKTAKEEPKIDYAALLVTRYEVYYIKDGKVDWEGKLRAAPIKSKGNLYVLSDDNVFCASEEGTVFWRKIIPYAQRLELAGNKLRIITNEGSKELDAKTGESQPIW